MLWCSGVLRLHAGHSSLGGQCAAAGVQTLRAPPPYCPLGSLHLHAALLLLSQSLSVPVLESLWAYL